MSNAIPLDNSGLAFEFDSRESGIDALQSVIDAMAGKCGFLYFIPPAPHPNGEIGRYGFVRFHEEGNRNSLAWLTYPPTRDPILRYLGISEKQLRSMFSNHLEQHKWFEKPSAESEYAEAR